MKREAMLVLMIGLFSSPRGNQGWRKLYFPLGTSYQECIEYARTRRIDNRRGSGRELDPYTDSILAAGDFVFFTVL